MDSSPTNSRLNRRVWRALLAGARAVSPEVHYDEKGYAARWDYNVLNGLPLADIASDFEAGAGHELDSKFRAAHSSSAFAVNTFGPWRKDAASLHIAGQKGFHNFRFEVTVPTGLGGTPPHLDVLAEGDSILAVEAKCTEWTKCKPAVFSGSYDRLRSSHGHSPWFEQMQQLRAEPDRYKFLDAAQLVKHAFGLMSRFGSDEVRLVYLFWEPRNAQDWPECSGHRGEAEGLATKVEDSTVRLVPISCHELWTEWERHSPTPSHLSYLKARYGREA